MPMPTPSAPGVDLRLQPLSAFLALCSGVAPWSVAGPLFGRMVPSGKGVPEDECARCHMARGRSVVMREWPSLSFRNLRHVRGADLHFKRRGDSVEAFTRWLAISLRMLMQIDETGATTRPAA